MNELNVTVIEQPGALGREKARQLAQILARYYRDAPPELRAEIDRKAEEIRRREANPDARTD